MELNVEYLLILVNKYLLLLVFVVSMATPDVSLSPQMSDVSKQRTRDVCSLAVVKGEVKLGSQQQN